SIDRHIALLQLSAGRVSRACALFFFPSLPRPPEAALFPYTTLFRSHAHTGSKNGPKHQTASRRRNTGRRFAAGLPAIATGQRHGDRKSTRLNSSHVKISYAVFCLKKKKQDQEIQSHPVRKKPPAPRE